MAFVLSGTAGFVLLGTDDSSYEEPECSIRAWNHRLNQAPSNYANNINLTCWREGNCGQDFMRGFTRCGNVLSCAGTRYPFYSVALHSYHFFSIHRHCYQGNATVPRMVRAAVRGVSRLDLDRRADLPSAAGRQS